MVRHGGSSAGSYLADPTSPIPSHCASIVVTSTVRVKRATLQGWAVLFHIAILLIKHTGRKETVNACGYLGSFLTRRFTWKFLSVAIKDASRTLSSRVSRFSWLCHVLWMSLYGPKCSALTSGPKYSVQFYTCVNWLWKDLGHFCTW